MATFDFRTITPDQAFNLQTTDIVVFAGGSANTASVTYDPVVNGLSTITVTFGGRAVAFGVDIVTASANQNLHFDDGSLLLIGGPRAEELVGLARNDALFGGGGNDVLLGHSGDNLIQGNQGDDMVLTDEGADTIFGGQGDDNIVTGIGGAADERGDFAQGNLGNDTIHGGGAGDILLGGQGNDSLQGGGGGDWMLGDRGDDTLSGGAGGDVFFAVPEGGDDRVLDFNGAEGDRVRVEAGVPFEVHQFGADTIILIDHGASTITLVGVQASTLQADWIVNV